MIESKSSKPVQQKTSFKALLKEMSIIFGAFLVLNSFVLASFEVPTGSMENEIMTGDFLLVNKFVFGGTTPRTIPFTSTKIPSFKLPALWNVERGDIIVFIFPGYRDEVEPAEFAYYLKRCIAVSGDTLQVINRVVYVNGKPAPLPRNVKFNSTLIRPAGYADARIFPKGAPFNEDNYGPIVIPKKGDIIDLTEETFERWEIFIRREGHTAELRNGKVHIDGVEATSYTVGRDYVFGMGDNRDNSLDSRFWGFIPTNSVVGTPLIVYWSWDPDIPLFNIGNKLSSIRMNRFGTLVK
ncbi:MAG: signal peptidase I [Ignavibacteria bacterium]|nr:signal peptidase I [Ignavibacteria bacterium]MBI3765101.1 signal peptidase I [Ignavibacteriales bacterium]